MDSTFVRTLTIIGAVGSGLIAGVFFAFSTFVMSGLRKAPAPAGIAAMQSMNREAPTPAFMLAWFGATGICIVLGIVAITKWGSTAATLAVIAAILSLVPAIVTGAYHQPRNLAFEHIDPTAPGSVEAWRSYLAGWVPWNHVRTVSSAAAAVLLTISVRSA